jgi:hypothetical protein
MGFNPELSCLRNYNTLTEKQKMPGIAIGLFFLLGFVLTFVGYIWGLVQAFGEETVWGVLYLLVPFAALVFYIKNWGNKQIRKTFLIQCTGLLMFVLGGSIALIYGLTNFAQQSKSEFQVTVEPNQPWPSPFPSDLNTSPSPSQESSPRVDAPVVAAPNLPSIPAQKYDFKQSMQLGYLAYENRDYQTALINFNRALQARPGDAYATKAIDNTKKAIAQTKVK